MKKTLLFISFFMVSLCGFTETAKTEKVFYPANEFTLEYMQPHHDYPCLCEFMSMPIPLKHLAKPNGFDVALTKEETRYLTIEELNDTEISFYYTKEALDKIAQTIVEGFQKKKINDVKVQIDPKEIDSAGKDIRDSGNHRLIFQIFIGQEKPITSP
jgi:threonyl-tRNA synthetase